MSEDDLALHGAEQLLAVYRPVGLPVAGLAELEQDLKNIDVFPLDAQAQARADTLMRVVPEEQKLLHILVEAVPTEADTGVVTRSSASRAEILVSGASAEDKQALISFSIASQGSQ